MPGDSGSADWKDQVSKALAPLRDAFGSVSSQMLDGAKGMVSKVRDIEENSVVGETVKQSKEQLNVVLTDVKGKVDEVQSTVNDQVKDVAAQTEFIQIGLREANKYRREYPEAIVGASALLFAFPALFRGRFLRFALNSAIGGGAAAVTVRYLEIQDRKSS
eukprot:CAMPEP_0118963580 /NCGR_PEP_ID=MMETSP1173-20130426/1411_1 /TAXON_ID=1034831 /ORGANISM="Rhizochromulina marina cf, Strain CCMP1243" /LENGTH=160 /DNA_ID=CAMNT_0006911919 /DNA_START=28 /DNA_END=510 /DNA_ORIENTATION=+